MWKFLHFLNIDVGHFYKTQTQTEYQIMHSVPGKNKILIINPVIRLFLLCSLLKNYTTNFNETLHVL